MQNLPKFSQIQTYAVFLQETFVTSEAYYFDTLRNPKQLWINSNVGGFFLVYIFFAFVLGKQGQKWGMKPKKHKRLMSSDITSNSTETNGAMFE